MRSLLCWSLFLGLVSCSSTSSDGTRLPASDLEHSALNNGPHTAAVDAIANSPRESWFCSIRSSRGVVYSQRATDLVEGRMAAESSCIYKENAKSCKNPFCKREASGQEFNFSATISIAQGQKKYSGSGFTTQQAIESARWECIQRESSGDCLKGRVEVLDQ